jgi:hypothetical protein
VDRGGRRRRSRYRQEIAAISARDFDDATRINELPVLAICRSAANMRRDTSANHPAGPRV